MVRVVVFTELVDRPGSESRAAVARAKAAARRFGDRVRVDVVLADSDEAFELGVYSAPAVAVDDLLLIVGRAPSAGHIARAVELALEGA